MLQHTSPPGYDCSCDLCSCNTPVGKPDGICSDCLKAEHK